MPPVSSCRRSLLAAAATAVAAAGVSSPPALAAGSAPGCPAAATTNPFGPWGDGGDYQLAPAGDVEDAGASWSLRGGAAAQEGNEPFTVTGAGDHRSLRLPASGSATTAPMCIGVEHTHFRFFVKRSGGSAASRMLVDVVYDDARGHERSVAAGIVDGSATWAPSAQLPTVVNALAALNGDAIDVAFRFRPAGGGVWSIDDVYVDPYRTH